MKVIDALQYSKPSRDRFLEWREAGISAVHVTVAIWEDAVETMREVGAWNRRFLEHDDLIAKVHTPGEIEEIADSGRTGVILGLQNSTPFQDDLDLVGAFKEAGVHIAQLTYNTQNSAGAGCWENGTAGLSQTYGRNLIREMNQVGITVDLSHSNDLTTIQAAEASEKPIAITHANPREYVGDEVELHFRNKSKDALRAVADGGGVVGLSMYPRLAPNAEKCTVDDYCDMIAWTADLIGIEHVGIGSDFYTGHDDEEIVWWRQGRWSRVPLVEIQGTNEFPSWFQAGRGYELVIAGLRSRGLSEADIEATMFGNWSRLFYETF